MCSKTKTENQESPKLHICSSEVAMCQLKLTGHSSGIPADSICLSEKTRTVLYLSPIFLVYGWGPWGTYGAEGVERIRAWEGPFQEQGCPSARIRKELSFPSWEKFVVYLCLCCCCSAAKLCPTLCEPMDCSPSGSTVHGVLLARILEWLLSPSLICAFKRMQIYELLH